MAWLKAYDDEHKRWPIPQKVLIRPEYRELLVEKLAAQFSLNRPTVRLTTRGGGRAHRNVWGSKGGMIDLPSRGVDCRLGTVFHEVAHIYDFQKYNHSGHQLSFRNALGLVYTQGWIMLPEIFKSIRAQVAQQQATYRKAAIKVEKAAERQVAFKQLKKTNEWKAEHLRNRIRRLESKARRLNTLIKSAKRSLGIHERIIANKKAVVQEVK